MVPPGPGASDGANFHNLDLDAGALSAAVRTEQLRLLAARQIDLLFNIIVASLVVATIGHIYGTGIWAGWLAMFLVVVLARYWLRLRFSAAADDAETMRRWGIAFTGGALATGLLWGLTGSVVLVTSNSSFIVFVVFVLGGMMAGGIVGNAVYLPAMVAFLLPTILPAVIVLLASPVALHKVMALLLVVFTAAMTNSGRNINLAIAESLRLRFGEKTMVTRVQASEAALVAAQGIASVGNWAYDVPTGLTTWSAEMYRILGLNPALVTASYDSIFARIHPDDQAEVNARHVAWLADDADFGLDHRIVMPNGTVKWVHEMAHASLDAQGRRRRLSGTIQDITARKTAKTLLEFTNLLLATQMEASPDGILIVDAGHRIIAHNQRFADMWQIPAAAMAAGDDNVVLDSVVSAVTNPEQFRRQVDYLYDHPGEDNHARIETTDGRVMDRHTVTLHGPTGLYLGRAWFFRDITEQEQAIEQAIRFANFDVLTGLANRAAFAAAVERAVVRAKRGRKGFAVLYLDLDHFKDVNDTLGHPVGDALLVVVAQRLRSSVRDADTVARFGGDEFAVIIAELDEPASVALLADKLIHKIAAPFSIQGNTIFTGTSIGIDVYGPGSEDVEALLSHADVALYGAKREGRGGYRFFTDAMDKEVRLRVALGTELRKAVDTDELFLLYQPQVVVATGQITGVEALVRWRHPQRGTIGPGVFIPIAESIGIISRLGHWVLWEACRQCKAWLDAGLAPIRVCVNVSGGQFRTSAAMEADIVAALAETGLPAHLLELELTESVLMDASRDHAELLQRLSRLGVTVAIDDFGTGYSSLDYLRRFPSNRIKIAQTFVKDLETTPGDAAIVKATIGLARELGIMVIAEGAERQAQVDLLRSWGCADIQGYYFAPPLVPDEIARLMQGGGIIPPNAGLADPAA